MPSLPNPFIRLVRAESPDILCTCQPPVFGKNLQVTQIILAHFLYHSNLNCYFLTTSSIAKNKIPQNFKIVFQSEKMLVQDSQIKRQMSLWAYLNTIGGCWYFERVLVPLRLKNHSLYHKILLLQKFNDISGKVLKPKKIQPPTSKKKIEAVFHFFIF